MVTYPSVDTVLSVWIILGYLAELLAHFWVPLPEPNELVPMVNIVLLPSRVAFS